MSSIPSESSPLHPSRKNLELPLNLKSTHDPSILIQSGSDSNALPPPPPPSSSSPPPPLPTRSNVHTNSKESRPPLPPKPEPLTSHALLKPFISEEIEMDESKSEPGLNAGLNALHLSSAHPPPLPARLYSSPQSLSLHIPSTSTSISTCSNAKKHLKSYEHFSVPFSVPERLDVWRRPPIFNFAQQPHPGFKLSKSQSLTCEAILYSREEANEKLYLTGGSGGLWFSMLIEDSVSVKKKPLDPSLLLEENGSVLEPSHISNPNPFLSSSPTPASLAPVSTHWHAKACLAFPFKDSNEKVTCLTLIGALLWGGTNLGSLFIYDPIACHLVQYVRSLHIRPGHKGSTSSNSSSSSSKCPILQILPFQSISTPSIAQIWTIDTHGGFLIWNMNGATCLSHPNSSPIKGNEKVTPSISGEHPVDLSSLGHCVARFRLVPRWPVHAHTVPTTPTLRYQRSSSHTTASVSQTLAKGPQGERPSVGLNGQLTPSIHTLLSGHLGASSALGYLWFMTAKYILVSDPNPNPNPNSKSPSSSPISHRRVKSQEDLSSFKHRGLGSETETRDLPLLILDMSQLYAKLHVGPMSCWSERNAVSNPNPQSSSSKGESFDFVSGHEDGRIVLWQWPNVTRVSHPNPDAFCLIQHSDGRPHDLEPKPIRVLLTSIYRVTSIWLGTKKDMSVPDPNPYSTSSSSSCIWIGLSTGKIQVIEQGISHHRDRWLLSKEWKAHTSAVIRLIPCHVPHPNPRCTPRSNPIPHPNPHSIPSSSLLFLSGSDRSPLWLAWDASFQQDHIDNLLKQSLTLIPTLCQTTPIETQILSWNVNGLKPAHLASSELWSMLYNSADLVVVGLEEIVDLGSKSGAAKSMIGGGGSGGSNAVHGSHPNPHSSHEESNVIRERSAAWAQVIGQALNTNPYAHTGSEAIHVPHPNPHSSHSPDYVLLGYQSLVGLWLGLWLARKHALRVRSLEWRTLKTGLGGLAGNKGGLSARLLLDQTSLLFQHAHLAAGETNIGARNSDAALIIKSTPWTPLNHIPISHPNPHLNPVPHPNPHPHPHLTSTSLPNLLSSSSSSHSSSSLVSESRLTPCLSSSSPTPLPPFSPLPYDDLILFEGGSNGAHTLDASYCFFFGDLNYRLNCSRAEALSHMNASSSSSHLQSSSLSSLFLSHDQLVLQRSLNPLLTLVADGFLESSLDGRSLNFLPTYKYDPGSQAYDTSSKQRVPSWCDRILYRSQPSRSREATRVLGGREGGGLERSEAGLSLVRPLARFELLHSDHRPIAATFRVPLRLVEPSRMNDYKAKLSRSIENK